MFNTLAVKANLAVASLKERAANKAEHGGFDKLLVTVILIAAAAVIGGALVVWFRGNMESTVKNAQSGVNAAGTGAAVTF
jgi:hypothetical protein